MVIGENLNKSWGATNVLQNVSVAIERGQITALIGPSGSGKTTLIRALSLLDPPNTGKISIDHNTYDFPLSEEEEIIPPWPDVSVVFQQLFLWPHLRLRENITLPLENGRIEDPDRRVEDIIDTFDMRGFIDRYPNETSLGQRQRVALARALVLQPSYILLDEITSALDVENVSVILSQLETLRDEGIGILIVTHLVGFARRAADRIVFIDNGQVLETGDRGMLDSPKNERLKRFVSVLESAM
jgi:ABC-type polar amino acid transport system ATPase subunit